MAGMSEEWEFRLTLIRHGETDQNRNKIIQGHDNTVLNETGKQQVELVGNRFKYEHLTRIYSSDLERAFKTAEGICLRNVHFRDLKIYIDTALRERNYGEAEGKSRQELKKTLSTGKLPYGAETEAQVHKRTTDFFTTLLRDVNHLRKSIATKVETNEESDESEECDCDEGSLKSKSDSSITDGIRGISGSGPSSDRSKTSLNDNKLSPDIRHRASSFPVSNLNRKSLSPVLLKDLCYNVDDPSKCDHTNRPVHVMLVSHGGIIRHLVSYFAKNFPSQFPVEKRKLLRQICPNTGVSEFAIFLSGQKVTCIDCVQLYDQTHLMR